MEDSDSPLGFGFKCNDFNEGKFKSALKKLDPIDEKQESCAIVRKNIIAELAKNSNNSSAVLGINNSLTLFKVSFEFRVSPSISIFSHSDPFYHFMLEPILPEILLHFNTFIFNYFQRSAEELVDSSESSATTAHQLICLIHKAVRIILLLLKRISMISSKNESERESVMLALQPYLSSLDSSFSSLLEIQMLELPLDVKCNLGLGLCYIYKICDGDEILCPEYLSRVFAPQNESGQSPVNRIAFMFGLLTVTGTQDPYFHARMQKMGEFIFTVDHGSKEALNLGSARVLELWTERLVRSHSAISPSEDLFALFHDVEFFVFSYLPGHIDAVKSCCRNILKSLTVIYDRMEPCMESSQVKRLLERILVKPQHVKWIAISCIVSTTPKSTVLLQIDPNISQSLLCSDRTMKNAASDAYLGLMNHHFSKVSVDQWEATWIEPLFATQALSPNETNWPQKRSIIASILSNSASPIVQVLLDFIVRKMNSTTLSGCTESSLLAVEAIKLASELQAEIKSCVDGEAAATFFRGIVPREALHAWTWSSSMQIRLACFSLLVETKKTSEVITTEDLESLKILFKYNIVSQNPAFRQQFFSYYKRFLKRLRDSRNLLVRSREGVNLERYEKFFEWLWKFLTEDEGLFPGSNFARRCQSLEFLAELLKVFDISVLKIEVPTIENLSYFRLIFDTYEHNKKLVFPILHTLYASVLSQGELGQSLLDASFRLCESVHPPDSVTGRYLGLFLIHETDNTTPWLPIYDLLEKIVRKLTEMLESIQKTSLIEVASGTQMYGYFRFIRMIFGEYKGFTANYTIYRLFATKLLTLCLDYNEILLPVLGDAAPEGFLPGLPDSERKNSHVVRSINAQRLLVCSWRSMRDICLLLAEMCSVLSIEGETEHFVWTFEQVKVIGDHLLFLLKNVMHRGVFEQVFTGFKQLAYRLFKSSSQKLNELPEKWLNDALDEELISTKCITRRSAGLPFIFQALLAPACSNDAFISKYVDRLFEQYAHVNSSSVRIHCTNVLRGLFRDANFSRVIMPYVPKGLQLAFEELKSPNWNECNAGLMLYGAIIRRTLGPKLNLMTAPTFFRKFPDMYDFMLGQIRKCAAAVVEMENEYMEADDFTYQVLLLLSSFAVNGVVEYGPLKLSEFVAPIHSCGSSPDFQVREIAAKALIPFLIQPLARTNFILSTLKQYDEPVLKKTSNEIHGDLLQILSVLKCISEEDSKNAVIGSFNKIFTLENSFWNFVCPTIYEALAEICVHIGPTMNPVHEVLQSNYTTAFATVSDRRSIPGLPNADEVMARVQILFTLQSSPIHSTVYAWLDWQPMSFLLKLFTVLKDKKFLEKEISSSDQSEDVVVFDMALRRYLREEFVYIAQSTEEESFLEFLANVSSSFYRQWAEFPGNADALRRLFEKLLLICQLGVGTVECKKWALIALGRLTLESDTQLTNHQKESLCEILATWCDPNGDADLRFAAAKCIPWIPFEKMFDFSVSEQCKIWFTILTLMLDDEVSVRNELNAKINSFEEEGEKVCDRKAAEIILSKFLKYFVKTNVVEGLVVITGLIFRDDYEIPVTDADDGEEEHLFERSEMNAYAEPILLAKILSEHLSIDKDLHSLFRLHFFSTALSPELILLYAFVANEALPLAHHPTQPTLATLIATNASSSSKSPNLNALDGVSEKEFIQNYTLHFFLSLLNS